MLPLEPRPGARWHGRSQAPDVPAAAHGSSFQPDLWTGPILADGVNDEVLVHLVILGQSIFFQTTDISVLIQLVGILRACSWCPLSGFSADSPKFSTAIFALALSSRLGKGKSGVEHDVTKASC